MGDSLAADLVPPAQIRVVAAVGVGGGGDLAKVVAGRPAVWLLLSGWQGTGRSWPGAGCVFGSVSQLLQCGSGLLLRVST